MNEYRRLSPDTPGTLPNLKLCDPDHEMIHFRLLKMNSSQQAFLVVWMRTWVALFEPVKVLCSIRV